MKKTIELFVDAPDHIDAELMELLLYLSDNEISLIKCVVIGILMTNRNISNEQLEPIHAKYRNENRESLSGSLTVLLPEDINVFNKFVNTLQQHFYLLSYIEHFFHRPLFLNFISLYFPTEGICTFSASFCFVKNIEGEPTQTEQALPRYIC